MDKMFERAIASISVVFIGMALTAAIENAYYIKKAIDPLSILAISIMGISLGIVAIKVHHYLKSGKKIFKT